MPILTIGLNHRTASVELRERLALNDDELQGALRTLLTFPSENQPTLQEAAILSTCNRLEVYAVAADVQQAQEAIEIFLAHLQHSSLETIRPHLYHRVDAAAVTHLMRVASGLDSMVLGEPQILGQVSHALNQAQAAGTTGPILSHLFARALHAGKRARAETEISRYTTSMSHAAVLLAEAHVADLTQANVLVLGAGEMAELAIEALQMRDAKAIGCLNRTYERALALVDPVQGRAFNWYHLEEALVWADAVIGATSAPHTVIHREDVAEAFTHRGDRPLVFVDIALPRDVEADVEEISRVHRYDIDDLKSTLDANLAQRQAAIPDVEEILAGEADQFQKWLRSRQVVPVLVAMRRQVEEIAARELDEALQLMPELDEREQEIVGRLVHRLVRKILHEPTVQLKAQAAAGHGLPYAQAVQTLFDLKEQVDLSRLTPIVAVDPATNEAKRATDHNGGNGDGREARNGRKSQDERELYLQALNEMLVLENVPQDTTIPNAQCGS